MEEGDLTEEDEDDEDGIRFVTLESRFQNKEPVLNTPLWKRVIAWERSRAASGYGIIWRDADQNKQEEFSAECHSMDWF